MGGGRYANTGVLLRFIVRRDRVRLPLWLASFAIVTWMVAVSLPGLYATAPERQTLALTMDNPAMTAMVGVAYGKDNYTFGAMLAHQMLLLSGVVAAIMNILLTARHTRADEEDGRLDLLRSLPVGRLSGLHAAVLTLVAANVMLALVVGFGLAALGVESIDVHGSLLYGAALGAVGIVFAAVTALFAQLSESARGTVGLSIAALLVTYLLRAAGDVGNSALSWLSPLGWMTRTEAYVNNDWRPIVLLLVVSVVLFALASYINTARDLGSGLLPSRPGRRHASALLSGPMSLGLRLQRTGLIAWAIGLWVIGASYGSVFGDLDAYFAENETMRSLLPAALDGAALAEPVIAMLMSTMAIISTIPALLAVLKLSGEEKKGRLDHLLSRAVSRTRLLGGYVVISLAAGLVMLLLSAVGMGAVGVTVLPEGPAFGQYVAAGLVNLPAVWAMTGVAVLMIGAAPRWTGIVWLYVAFAFIADFLGELLQLPRWVSGLSPFAHVAQWPYESWNMTEALCLTAAAAVVGAAGFIAYTRRDIQG